MQSDILYTSKDYGLAEFCPVNMKDTNAKINQAMSSKTYYFSYAAGVKNKNKMKPRERLEEPTRSANMGAGFNLDIDHYLKYTERTSKVPRRPTEKLSLYERLCMTCKVLFNFVSINNNVFFEN
jgi:hypothetical protein